MLRALIAGKRDPQQLAELARGRLRNKIPALAAALEGRFVEHHAIMIGLALDHFEYLERSVVRLDERIDELIAEHSAARDRLDTIPGVGKRGQGCRSFCARSLLNTHWTPGLRPRTSRDL